MAKIDYIKLSKKRDDGKCELVVRLYVNRNFKPQYRSGLFIQPDRLINRDNTDRCRHYEIYVPKTGTHNQDEVNELKTIDKKFKRFLDALISVCDATEEKHKDELTAAWIENSMRLINKYGIKPENVSYQKIIDLQAAEKEDQRKGKASSFFDLLVDFRDNAKKKVNGRREGDKSDVWKKNFNVLIRALHRYEMFVQIQEKDFKLNVDKLDSETIEDIESYLRNEFTLIKDYPDIYERIPATTDTKRRSPKPQPRGNNTICALFNKFRAFYHYLNEKSITLNNPFMGYEGVTTERYGTPFYLTLEERNQIADFDLSEEPQLAVQRDIFIFQCLIGCRVSDLNRLSKKNVTGGFIEYIPTKTKGERQSTVRVPLNSRAKAIVKKYKGVDKRGRLLPVISYQRYNDDIKAILTKCGVTRMVTVLDTVTGEEAQRAINEVASSHMARRTFIGNLYKRVKDPNLIASMSGHAEGSKAFARYRAIDDDVKKELVDLIN